MSYKNVKEMEKMLIKRILIIVPIAMSTLFIVCKSSNRLSNTTWEGYSSWGEEAVVVFGENTFQLSRDAEVKQVGSYKISGDAVFLNNESKPSGSLIGDKLILSGLLIKYEFKRVK
jgi:hypothetical protein